MQNVNKGIEQYGKALNSINSICLSSISDSGLKDMAAELKAFAANGAVSNKLLIKAFALAREASRRVTGLYPFDEQVIAGLCLQDGKLVEMKTGEGKTLAAVMPAYLNALSGRGVHILTFNDYLAHRDAEWVGPIYEFLGLSVGYIKEGMNPDERKKAYFSDITYVTAKECGFDYLRDFLCVDKDKLVQRPFNYAIVDEADSILIDEARIPLVIAGEISENGEAGFHLSRLIKGLKKGKDYEIDQYERNVFLTDEGLQRIEEMLGCGNLYMPENLELLTGLNCALHAEVLLERDKDYIVRNGKVEIIDEFTGRIADKRHWPDKLQAAVAAKEGLVHRARGIVLGSVTLQHFLSLYPKLAGMTGTALTAAGEFKDFYCMDVVVIPTHKPCTRMDHPDVIFLHKAAKQKALVSEIKRIHETGRPVLIGTGSVEESEELARDLKNEGVACVVLNARNDEMEASIIAKAGEIGAVTVSTNMAGRGVDIKLGGEKGQDREKVAALGGLYIIGTGLNESRRIDNQLRGRGGRQGDPGESRFFISLEDSLFRKYGFAELIPAKNYPGMGEEPAEDAFVRQAIQRGQRIIEGYNYDIRKQLGKYAFLIEQQRRIIHNMRQGILKDNTPLRLLSERAAERYYSLCNMLGKDKVKEVEKQITLFYINKCWSEYLDYISYVREGIHLVCIGKKDPLHEFCKIAVEAFDEMLDKIDSEVLRTFNQAEITGAGIDMGREGLEVPSSTWTYLINDSPEQFSNLSFLIKAASNFIDKPLFTLRSLFGKITGSAK
ncbi:MAG: accessory Sec system translocase SecA2 [Caulobacteraceae bacterium]